MAFFSSGNIFRLLCICMGMLAGAVKAQPRINLAQLTDRASRNLPLLMQKQALAAAAQATVTDIRHGFLPSLRANIQTGIGTDNSLPGAYNSFGIIPSTSSGVRPENDMQPATSSIAILHGEYDLLDFGYKRASINRAEQYASVQSADYNRQLYVVQHDVAQLYFNLVRQQTQLDIDRRNTERYAHIFEIIRALAHAGLKPGSDSSLAKAELSKAIVSYNQTLGEVNNLREQLSYYTGMGADSLQTDSLPTLASVFPLHSFIDSTLTTNPLLLYYDQLRELNAREELLAAKVFMPRVYLVASAWARGSSITPQDEYKSPAMGIGFQRYNYLAGIAIQYDLFNGLHRNDRLKIYHYETEAGRLQYQQQQRALQSAITQANLAIHTYEVNLGELPVQIQAAQDTYNQKLAQYKAGIISLIDLTNATFVLYRSLNDYTETLTQWYLAQLDKATANGQLDQFIKAIK